MGQGNMAVSKASSSHTAITTWSGFVYQGKVAIYHVLRILEQQGMTLNLVLQLDGLEDFAILDENGSVISMHQVKALKSTYYSAYQDAFEQLKNKAAAEDCADAHFHVAQQINGTNPEYIEATHFPVKLYCYDPDPWCPLCEIDNKIEDRIRSIFWEFFPDDSFRITGDYKRKVRGYLDQIILKKVIKIHSMVHEDLMSDREAAHKETIPLSDFWHELERDLNQEGLGDDYYFWMLLGDLCRYYQEFCMENEIVDKEDSSKLFDCMKKISELDKDEMIHFIRNIMPNRIFKFDKISDYKDSTFHREEILDAFLRMLRELKTPEFDDNKFFRWNSGDTIFTPTTIDQGPSNTTAVCQRIIKNALNTDLDVLFEGGNLITTDIDVESIVGSVHAESDTPEYDLRKADLITRWKKVSLISLNNAKERINA